MTKPPEAHKPPDQPLTSLTDITDEEVLRSILSNLKWVDGHQINAFVHPSLLDTAVADLLAAGFTRTTYALAQATTNNSQES